MTLEKAKEEIKNAFDDDYSLTLDIHGFFEFVMDTLDEINSIDNPKKKALTVQVPSEYTNINQQAFNEWMAYKKYKNKGAITKTLNMLNKYDFQTQQEMVDKSIMNEYKGLFEPKQKKSKTDKNIEVAKSWIEENDFLNPNFIGNKNA